MVCPSVLQNVHGVICVVGRDGFTKTFLYSFYLFEVLYPISGWSYAYICDSKSKSKFFYSFVNFSRRVVNPKF